MLSVTGIRESLTTLPFLDTPGLREGGNGTIPESSLTGCRKVVGLHALVWQEGKTAPPHLRKQTGTNILVFGEGEACAWSSVTHFSNGIFLFSTRVLRGIIDCGYAPLNAQHHTRWWVSFWKCEIKLICFHHSKEIRIDHMALSLNPNYETLLSGRLFCMVVMSSLKLLLVLVGR